MKGKEAKAYLEDILQAVETIRQYAKGMELEKFRHNRMAVDAVIRQLAIIGEAAGRLPAVVRKKEPQIPWAKIVGMRNKLVHAYAEVDEGVIWDVVGSDLDSLEQAVRRLLQEKS
jgi:uncharacterized protein with HEPN domain